jgi:hypothetical protein
MASPSLDLMPKTAIALFKLDHYRSHDFKIVKLNQQVPSQNLGKRINALEVIQEGHLSWNPVISGPRDLGDSTETMNNAFGVGRTTAPPLNNCAAFSVAESGDVACARRLQFVLCSVANKVKS